jgi:hypothetical protein
MNPYPLRKGQAYARAYAECGFLEIFSEMRTGSRRDAMNENGSLLPWVVIRQDDKDNRYRVARYATKDEAERTAEDLDASGHKRLYCVERVGQGLPHL